MKRLANVKQKKNIQKDAENATEKVSKFREIESV
jgi:hypothetical protein